jgi:hypothetical protein
MRKKSGYLAVAITAALFTSNAYFASADVTPSPAPTFDSYKAAQEQYKKDRDAYFAALRDRESKMRSINAAFKNTVDKATTDARSAIVAATTPDQKNSINSTRRTAIAAAIVVRESAIAALGALPTPPVEPTKPPKVSTFGMSEQKGKQKR